MLIVTLLQQYRAICSNYDYSSYINYYCMAGLHNL